MPNNGQLRPYGFIPGKDRGWCAACKREVNGMHEDAFKCRTCALEQFNEVERLCDVNGMGSDQ